MEKAIDIALERRRVVDSIQTLNNELQKKTGALQEYVQNTGQQIEKIFAENLKKAQADLKQYIDAKTGDLSTGMKFGGEISANLD